MASPSSDTGQARPSTRTEYAWCLATILFSLAWWFSPFLFRGYTFISEAIQMNWTDWRIGRQLLVIAGGTAEWNPYSLFGVDWVGREAFLSPVRIGALAGYLIPGDKASFVLVTMVCLAGMGLSMYAFLRAISIRPAFARIGMVVYLLSSKWSDDAYVGPYFVVGYALTPLALLLILRMYEAGFRQFRHFVTFAVLVSLIYLGLGAPFLLIQAYLLASFFVYMLYRCWRESRHTDRMLLGRTAGWLIVTVALMAALSAYILLPFLENYRLSQRSLYAETSGWRVADYLGLVFPWLNRMYGHGVYDLPYPPVLPIFVPNVLLYVGILCTPVLAMGFARRLWTPVSGFFAFAFIAWLALWNHYLMNVFPLIQSIERLTQGSASQNQGHVILIVSMSVVLASVLQQVQDRREDVWNGRAGRWLGWLDRSLIAMYLLAAAVFAAGAVVLGTSLRTFFWSRVTVGHYLFLHYYFQEMAVTFIAVFLVRAAIVWVYHRRRFVSAWGNAALLLLMIADFQLVFRTVYPFTDLDARYDTGRMPNSFVLEHTGPLDRLGASQFQLNGASKADRLSALVAMPAPLDYAEVVNRFGKIYDEGFKKPLYEPSFSYFPVIAGRSFYGFHESLMPAYFWDFDQALNGVDTRYSRSSWVGLWDPHSPLLDVAGIKYLFWHEAVADPRMTEVAHYGNGSHVYVNRQAVPRAYLVSHVEHYESRADLMRRLQAPAFRPLEAVTTEDRSLYDAVKTGQETARAGDARIETYTPNRVVVDVNAPSRSVLVLNEMYHPNWTVRINGVESAMYRVNAVFRGVVVPAGASQVEFRYYNAAFHTGVAVSAATWVVSGLVLIGTSGLFRPRRVDMGAPVAVA